MADTSSSSNLLTRITHLFAKPDRHEPAQPEAAQTASQRLATVTQSQAERPVASAVSAEGAANDADLEAYENEAAEEARSYEPSHDDWLEHAAGESFLNPEQEDAARDTFFGRKNQSEATSKADPSPGAAGLPKTPEEFVKFIDAHAEPTALAAFNKQYRAIGVADITVISGQTITANKIRGEVSYNVRPATMEELRPEIAKAAAAGRLPEQSATVGSQGKQVILNEGRNPPTPRPLDLFAKSELMKEATQQLLERRAAEGRPDPSLSKNHKAIVEDFLTRNATAEQVTDFQQQLDTKGTATLTLVNAQTITATRTKGPQDLPAVRYDIRPATLAEYQPHLTAIQQMSANQGATPRTEANETVTDSVGRKNNRREGDKIYLTPTAADGNAIIRHAGKLSDLEQMRREGDGQLKLAPGVEVMVWTDTSAFGNAFNIPFTIAYNDSSQQTLANMLQAATGKNIQDTAKAYLDATPIAVILTADQTRHLIEEAHPHDVRAQAKAMHDITNTMNTVTVLNNTVSLDYSDNVPGYFAVLDKDAKPALDQKLTQLQAKQDRERTQSQKQYAPARRDRDDYERD